MSHPQSHSTDHTDWQQFRTEPVSTLALRLAGRTDLPVAFILQQVEGWQRLRNKVPSWAEHDELHYPPRLSLEQCSGEAAARYKAEVVSRLTATAPRQLMADLTGGLGVDFSFLAPMFEQAVYVEQREELCNLARNNFPILGLNNAEIVCADATSVLSTLSPATLIFIDPARRDKAGRKTVLIADCEPDVCSLQHAMLDKAEFVVIKLSTMLDISDALHQLSSVRELHIVAAGGECKDLLIVMQRGWAAEPVVCICEGENRLSFSMNAEKNATVAFTSTVNHYLLEPGPAVMKAGAFKWVAQHFGLKKLHPNSHLYTSAQPIDGFPGRQFEVTRTWNFSKQDLNALRRTHTQANLTIRNFPSSTDALRKKLKLREGGDVYLFATTLANGSHVLIEARKAAR